MISDHIKYYICRKKSCRNNYLNGTLISVLLILALAGTALGEITRDGLIAEYHFDGNGKDSSGNENNGLVNGATYIDGKFGQALSFDGENDFVRVPDSITLNATSITIEAWIFVNNSKSSRHSILTKMDKLQDSGYELYALQNNIPGFGLISTKETKNVAEGNRIPSNKWTYIAATYDGDVLLLYINGVVDAFNGKSGFLGTANKGDLYIGSWRDVDYFSGAIDEVRIYNRALNGQEIKNNFKSVINPVDQTPTQTVANEPTIQPTPTITPEISPSPMNISPSSPTPTKEITEEPTPIMTRKSPGFSSILSFIGLSISFLFIRKYG
jgi:hypothetical protein